jgi:hypothetical protein
MLKRMKIKKSEIASIIATTFVLALVITFAETPQILFRTMLIIFLIIMINFFGKKISAYYYDTEIKTKLWELQRYWFRAHDKFHRPFPIGIVLPFITTALTFGLVNWMACLTFDVKKPIYKAARRHDKTDYSFSEVTEWQTGAIATWGLAINLISALVAIKLGYPDFAKLSIYYTFYNIIPFSDLDGTKIFFAHKFLWIVSAIIILSATIIAVIA